MSIKNIVDNEINQFKFSKINIIKVYNELVDGLKVIEDYIDVSPRYTEFDKLKQDYKNQKNQLQQLGVRLHEYRKDHDQEVREKKVLERQNKELNDEITGLKHTIRLLQIQLDNMERGLHPKPKVLEALPVPTQGVKRKKTSN